MSVNASTLNGTSSQCKSFCLTIFSERFDLLCSHTLILILSDSLSPSQAFCGRHVAVRSTPLEIIKSIEFPNIHKKENLTDVSKDHLLFLYVICDDEYCHLIQPNFISQSHCVRKFSNRTSAWL